MCRGEQPATGADSVQAQVQEHHGAELFDHWLDTTCTASDGDLVQQMNKVVEIVERANLCELEDAAEPAWNDEVHSEFLRAALWSCKGIRHHNM